VADAQYSMVRTETGEKGCAALKGTGRRVVELMLYMISVNPSAEGIMRVIEEATVDGMHGRFWGPDGGELLW